MKDAREDEAYQFLSSIGQILDDVELVTKTVNSEEKHSSSKEDYVVTNGVIAQETRDSVSSTVESQLQAEANEVVQYLLDDDGSRVCDDEPDKSPKDETRKEDAMKSEKLGYNKFMLEDVWKAGCERLKKADLKKVRNDARERINRRQRVNKAVMEKVALDSNKANTVFKSDLIQNQPPWTRFIMPQYPEYYNDI